MKQFSRNLKFGLLALVALAAVSAFAGYPIFSPEVIASIGLVPMMVGDTTITAAEIKAMFEDQGKTFKEFKDTNDARLKALAEGKSVEALEAKMVKLESALDEQAEIKAAVDKLLLDASRFSADSKAKIDLDLEVKQWNLALRADASVKGRDAPAPMSSDEYVHYKSAFGKMSRHGNVERLSAEERKAMSAGSDPEGGFLLPEATIGRTVSRIWERSIIRQLASVTVLSSDAMEGMIDNDEASAGWVSELGARSDSSTPAVGKYRIEAHEMYAMPKISQKLLDDAAVDVEMWLANKVGDKFARVESAGFATGDGVGKPRGLFSYSTAATADDTRAWGVMEHVKTGTNGAFNATTKSDPLMDLIGQMKPAYLANATWLMNRAVRTAIRKLKEATTDRYLWEPGMQVGVPDRLLGYNVAIDQYVPALATDSLSLAFGDVREAFQIVDRLGIRTLRDPFTAKPYVVFYTTKRTGSGVVNFEAVKFLKFAA